MAQTKAKVATTKIKAQELAKEQKQVSVSEFFLKNRHLLGFDNPLKALSTTVKELCDNSLDACEEMQVLPEILVELRQTAENKFLIIVEDNGPGITKEQLPNVFARLLYGSKFHGSKQSLTGDEPIIIKRDGKIEIITMGELIDARLDKEGEVNCEDIEVPSFNWKTFRYTFKPVSHLIKHKRENEIYRIKTLYGKNIKVTGCHSVFTINKETLDVEEIEARNLHSNDIILAPKKIILEENRDEINLLDFILEADAKKHYWYLYIDKKIVQEIFLRAKIIFLKQDSKRVRKYYRFLKNERVVDILDDSYKQYKEKGFIPVWLAKYLDLKIENAVIKTYFHGEEHNLPIVWSLTPDLMKFIGLYVAEGHPDKRQIGFSLSIQERDLVKLICNVALMLGVSFTVEERKEKNSIRVKVFGSLMSYLFKQWCGHGAKQKKIPNFIYTASEVLRQHFLDYLYKGDGNNAQGRNQLTLSTTSSKLATEVIYLWLMQSVVASCSQGMKQGLGKKPSMNYNITVYGKDIRVSHYFQPNIPTSRRRCDLNVSLLAKILGNNISEETLVYIEKLSKREKEFSKKDLMHMFNTEKIGYKARFLLDNDFLIESSEGSYILTEKAIHLSEQVEKLKLLLESDFMLLPIKQIDMINKGYEFVYDISIPGSENFVGGFGGIACHNSRGQQGIGVSASILYGQLTTGKPARITSRIDAKHPAHFIELRINTAKNEPDVLTEKEIEWLNKQHGTRVEIELEGKYQKGKLSVDEYMKQSAISNPHTQFTYINPLKERVIYRRATNQMPKPAKKIQPHPHGIELGALMQMMKATKAKTMLQFLTNEFSRVSSNVAHEILTKAQIPQETKPVNVTHEQAEKLFKAIQETKIMAPPTDCLSPIGEEILTASLKKEFPAEFYASTTRSPSVYRGIPFQVEAAIAYGGSLPKEELVRLVRFANKVPLQYQQSACATTRSVINTMWRNYGLDQSKGAIPSGPAVLVIHIVSVWVPFTSESKEAIAHYPEIIKEIKLAVQEVGRKVYSYIRKNVHAREAQERINLFEKYIPEVADALAELSGKKKEDIKTHLEKILKKGMNNLLAQANGEEQTKEQKGNDKGKE